ncbi:hypothetical protein COCVIDRAFT_19491 [Bipolaris victoriae FI3]|uniref:Uncharacterized protein n=1 Tax=Bipolaris victoriae (strain FI3) TaxID=930091 RepID=W7E3T3_BIPV3|nr:hypothetical protein COCVIDRAFT_19491 [Bipolaris victoriae FI3]
MASTAGGTAQSFQTRPAVGNPARRVVCECAMENGWAVVGVWRTRERACVSDPGWATICPSIRSSSGTRTGDQGPCHRPRDDSWGNVIQSGGGQGHGWMDGCVRTSPKRASAWDASQCVGRYRAPAPRPGAGKGSKRTSARAGGGLSMSLTRGSRVLGESGSWMRWGVRPGRHKSNDGIMPEKCRAKHRTAVAYAELLAIRLEIQVVLPLRIFLSRPQLSSRDHVTCLTASSSIRLGIAPWPAWAAVIVQQVTCRREHAPRAPKHWDMGKSHVTSV